MHIAGLRYFRPGARVVERDAVLRPLRSLPAYLGAEHRLVHRRPEQHWHVDPSEVRRELDGGGRGPARTHLRHEHAQPQRGAHVRRRRARPGADAARADGVLISCEVYMEFAPRASASTRPWWRPMNLAGQPDEGLRTRAVARWVDRARRRAAGQGTALLDMTYLSYVDPPTMAVRAAIAAFDRLDAFRARIAEVKRESQPMLAAWLERTPGVQGDPPELD
jgi:hypothetical protein